MAKETEQTQGGAMPLVGMSDNIPIDETPSWYQIAGLVSQSQRFLQRCNGKLAIRKFASPVLGMDGGLRGVLFIETADQIVMLTGNSITVPEFSGGDDGGGGGGTDPDPVVGHIIVDSMDGDYEESYARPVDFRGRPNLFFTFLYTLYSGDYWNNTDLAPVVVSAINLGPGFSFTSPVTLPTTIAKSGFVQFLDVHLRLERPPDDTTTTSTITFVHNGDNSPIVITFNITT